MLTGGRAFLVSVGLAILALAETSNAQLITNVTASATSEYSISDRAAVHAVDRSGLSAGDNFASTPDQTHTTGADGEVWLTNAFPNLPQYFAATFDNLYSVTGFRVFNYNENFVGIGEETD